ncbi:tetratricopeptide repeat protein [Methanocaldococcus jannaschii]|nr:tetratricopeptide repeat protein [Methanocaldococcus jannaschii]
MDKNFTLEILNLLKNNVLKNRLKIGKELTEMLIDEIDKLIETANEISEEISKNSPNNSSLYDLRLIYNKLSTLYEDIDKLLGEIECILSLSNKDIKNWKLWKNLGDKAYLWKAYYEALFCYNKALELNQNTELLCKKGYALLKLYKRDLAIKYFEKASEKDRNNYKALFGLGKSYYLMSDNKNSIKYFEKVLELNPNDVEALEYLGELYYEEDCEKAINYFKKALELKPDDIDLILKVAFTYFKLKKYKHALKYFEKALKLNPNVFELEQIYESMGRIYIYLGEDEKAIECFEKLKEINLYHYEIYEIIALTYEEVGNIEKAKEFYKKLV